MSRQWWKDNWDKVATAVVSIVVSGVVGFFSAVISIRSEMAELKERVVRAETQLVSTIIPKLQSAEENTKNIAVLQQGIAVFQKQTDISINTNKLLDLRMEQVRSEALQNLRVLLEDARKQPAVSK